MVVLKQQRLECLTGFHHVALAGLELAEQNKAGLKHRDLLASASQVIDGIKAKKDCFGFFCLFLRQGFSV